MSENNGFGQRHRQCREDHGLSLMAVASELGRNIGTVHQWEIKDLTPRVHDLAKLARLYGVSFEWLATGMGPKKMSRRPRQVEA